MPAARYWRAVGLQSVGGGALELSALHLYLGGARVDAAATLTSTFAPASGTLAALQDEDTATTARWLDVSAPGFALVWDFGAGNAQDVLAVRLGAGALYTEWLEALTLQYSSDGVAWETLGAIAAFSWPGANALQPVPADGDPHFLATSLLIQPRTAGAVFGDESTLRHGVAAVGQAKAVADAASPTGYSASFDGSGDWLQVSKSAAMVFGSGDFTVECRVTANPAARDRALVDFFASDIGGWQVYLDSSGKPAFYENTPNSTVLRGPSSVANGVPHHIAFARQGGALRLFVDGVLAGSGSNTKLHIDPGVDLYIGAQVGTRNINYDFDGKLAYVRITQGVARYTADFTPPAGPFSNGIVGATTTQLLLRAPSPERARIAASAPVPPHSTLSAPRLLTARNVEFAGSGTASATGTIYGSTAIKGSPNAPVRAKVSLLRARDLMLVQQTWSDPATGAYAFHGLDPAEKYTTLAEYPTGDYRAVAADQLTPDIEEARAP